MYVSPWKNMSLGAIVWGLLHLFLLGALFVLTNAIMEIAAKKELDAAAKMGMASLLWAILVGVLYWGLKIYTLKWYWLILVILALLVIAGFAMEKAGIDPEA